MFGFSVTTIVSYVLVLFFTFSGVGNLIGLEHMKNDLIRWGYPSWFHLVNGALQVTAAALIALPATRFYGLILAGAVCVAALATLVFHSEYARTIPSIVLIAILTTVAYHTGLPGREVQSQIADRRIVK